MGGKAVVRMSDLTASRALISDSDGDIAVSGVTTTELDILDGLTASTAELNIMDGVTATTTELNYVDGVTSAVQTQIDSKQATITGAATTIDDADLTASRAVISNASGKVAVSGVTTTELDILDGLTATTAELNIMDGVTATTAELNIMDGVTATTAELNYVDGVTSAIQTQIDSKQATITGAATTIDDTDLTASRAVISNASGKVAVSAVTDTELGYLDGVTSAIQTQIDSKQAIITGAATTIDDADLTASRAVISNASGKVAVSAVTDTELGYLDGVTSDIQTQLNAKSPTASPTFTGTVTIPGVTVSGGTQNWTATASGTNLTFAYNGVNKMRIDSSGNLTVTGNVNANGTIS
jgi:hypothetical protein